MATNASIWQVLLAIDCEELSIYIFFVEGPSYVSQKTKDNKIHYFFLGKILFLFFNLANFAEEIFFGSHKI